MLRFPLALFVSIACALVAGCVTPALDGAALETAAGDAALAVEPTTTPVDWDGRLGTGFCAPAGVGGCFGFTFNGESWVDVRVTGVLDFDLTLEWDAATPATAQLELSVISVESCGDGCWSSTQTYRESVKGTSPLSLADLGVQLAEDERLVIMVDSTLETPPGPVYGNAHPDQAFHLVGTLTMAPPAPPTPQP